MDNETSYIKPDIHKTHTSIRPGNQRILTPPKKTLKVLKNYINKGRSDGRPTMFSIKAIRDEITKFIQQDNIQGELNRLKAELEKLGPYKALKEPTKKHLKDIEKQYNFLVKRINQTQKQIDKEFNNALSLLQKRRKDAESRFKKLQRMALTQKKSVEKTIKVKLKEVTGTKKKRKKRKTTKKTTVRKAAAKKKTTRKKTT